MTKKEISKDQLVEFCESPIFHGIIQKNHEKYKKRWLKWTEKKEQIKFGRTLSWNWAGLLLGEFWLLYRKLYAMAFLFIFVRVLIVILPAFLPQLGNVLSFLSLILNLMVGIHSYDWYLAKTYTIYTKVKNAESQSPKNDQASFIEQGGTSLKSSLIYLATLVMLIALGIFYIMNNQNATNSTSSNTTSNSKYSENIEFVRGGVFAIDESIYLANALESYPYFKNYAWENHVSPQGRNIVKFIAEYDIFKELSETNFDFKSKKLSKIHIIFDFALSISRDDFSLHSLQVLIDGSPALVKEVATQEYAFELLSKMYLSQHCSIYTTMLILGKNIMHEASLQNAPKPDSKINLHKKLDNIRIIRKSTYNLDTSLSIGDALERYPYFSSFSWEQIPAENERTIVRFIGNYDVASEIQEMKTRNIPNPEQYFDGVSSASFYIDFSLSQDKKSFRLYQGHFILNGQSAFVGQNDYVVHLLEPIYQAVPFLGSSLNH